MNRMSLYFIVALLSFGLVGSSAPVSAARQDTPWTGGSNEIVSPFAVAAWIATFDGQGPNNLQLMVVWRGKRGWFGDARSRRHNSSGGQGNVVQNSLKYGEVELSFALDLKSRVATVQSHQVELHQNNVILVDDVDTAARLTVVRSLHVDDALRGSRTAVPLLNTSPLLVTFIQCEDGPNLRETPAEPRVVPTCKQ